MTNAQKIRAMSDEELAKMIYKLGRNYRVADYLKQVAALINWLQQPAGEEADHA